MTDFEGQIWAVQDNDEVGFICTTKRIKKRIKAINEKGRELRFSVEKLLWQHPYQASGIEDWENKLTTIQAQLNSLRNDIDLILLWETALELEISEINELADLYFGEKVTTEHLVALWQVLADDRFHFKRRGQEWEARTAEQIEELKTQREREQARAKAQALAYEWIQKIAKVPIPAFPHFLKISNEDENSIFPNTPISDDILPFVERLEIWLHGDTDKIVEELVHRTANTVKLTPRELVFEILQKIGRLPLDADRDAIVSGLKPEFTEIVQEATQAMQPWQPAETQTVTDVLFSIDDEDTQEVDDALSIERDGLRWKITIAIADPASIIHRGDILDKEAMQRGTTVYLPTQTILMLPPRVSCDLASLSVNQIRSSVVIRIWMDDQGQVTDNHINREAIRVCRRLHYEDADQLIEQGEDDTAQQLRDLLTCAQYLQTQRRADGAFVLQRPEYKISVQNNQITVTMLEKDSPSRLIVAEMMILANHIAAKYAYRHQIPLIYRVQDRPLEPITAEMRADPLGFQKARRLLGRSSLSLQPGGHSGLGLSMYTQLTSPLRRFADLVMQRQLMAHLMNEKLPYDREELLKVLETAERTARESRSIEGEAKRRWLMQYLKQNWSKKSLQVLIISEVRGGYKVEIQPWGIEAYLATNYSLELGQTATAAIEKIRVKVANARLKLVT